MPSTVLDVEEDAAGAAEQVAELLDGRPHRRVCRRSGQHLVDVLTDVEKWTFLTNLHDNNEVLLHRLVGEHVHEMLPIVYTPTVGGGYPGVYSGSAAPAACSSTSMPSTSSMFRNTPRNSGRGG